MADGLTANTINFDFSLVRCEAPREYQQLGAALTPFRRAEAEGGFPAYHGKKARCVRGGGF
ncbi:hypothetical protein F5X96DRAFT_620667 [Biscogniauxia mediterranea]|nr:hypothetical protein F5X96DRAFT_620667 [Biscogniauxia mediterranea]